MRYLAMVIALVALFGCASKNAGPNYHSSNGTSCGPIWPRFESPTALELLDHALEAINDWRFIERTTDFD